MPVIQDILKNIPNLLSIYADHFASGGGGYHKG